MGSDSTVTTSPLASTSSKTVLVVEDEVLVRTMISEAIRAHGQQVIEAANAEEALSVLHSPLRVDLVFTDFQMPGHIDGAGLVRQVRTEFPFITVIMASAKPPDASVFGLLDAYLPKPFAPPQIARCLDDVLVGSMGERGSTR